MSLKTISFFLLFFFITLTLFPLISLASNSVLPLVQCGSGKCLQYDVKGRCIKIDVCTLCDFFEMIDRIIRFILFDIVPPVAALMIAIAGFMLIFAYAGGGGPEMISRAKSIFKAVIIGLIIVYGAWLILDLFFSIISVNKSFLQSWNRICQ